MTKELPLIDDFIKCTLNVLSAEENTNNKNTEKSDGLKKNINLLDNKKNEQTPTENS